jgi:hypothetical protein
VDAEIKEAVIDIINIYGELYPYYNSYEILTDINEDSFNELKDKGILRKEVKKYRPLSYQ